MFVGLHYYLTLIALQDNLTKNKSDDILALYVSKAKNLPILEKLKAENRKKDIVFLKKVVKKERLLKKQETNRYEQILDAIKENYKVNCSCSNRSSLSHSSSSFSYHFNFSFSLFPFSQESHVFRLGNRQKQIEK